MPTMLSCSSSSITPSSSNEQNRWTKRSFQRMARRGSLPLKKRRFRLLETEQLSSSSAFSLFTPNNIAAATSSSSSSHSGIAVPLFPSPQTQTDTTSRLPYHLPPSSSTGNNKANHSEYNTENHSASGSNTATNSNFNNSKQKTFAGAPPLTKLSLMAAAAASRSRSRLEDRSSSWKPITPAPTSPKAATTAADPPKSPPNASYNKHHRAASASLHKKPTTPASLTAPLTPGRTQQDKRYTTTSSSSTDGECRCRATTTRGRACAYVAVNDTPYCYLHAEYATSPPPPRRHLKTTTTAIAAQPVTAAAATTSAVAKQRRRTSAKLAETHAAATAPLLSMISTDQWQSKAVRIALGPLMGRTGRVEKWGNGWVSVQLDTDRSSGSGGGWHNRRSFELVLLEDGGVGKSVETTTSHRPQTPMTTSPTTKSIAKVTPHEHHHHHRSNKSTNGSSSSKKHVVALDDGVVVDLRLPKDTKMKGTALQPRDLVSSSPSATSAHLVPKEE